MRPQQDPVPCCKQIVYAEFKCERLARIGLRHVGLRCLGRIDGIVAGAYIHQGRLLPNKEVWRREPAR
jgi:hypothetical protein